MELLARLRRLVFEGDLGDMPPSRRWPLALARGLFAIGRDLAEGQLTLRAMSLVYTTLLSMVPLLALAFSVLKAFGVHNQVEPFLYNLLQPLGERSEEIVFRVISFVDNMRVGVLGFLGLVFLVYTAVSLVQKIEDAFNYTWRVRRHRNLAQRFSGYLSVILIGPVLVVSAMGVTASVMSTALMQQVLAIEPFGTLVALVGRLVPYLLIIGAFAFIYVFVPNTRVRALPALVGALVAGLLWQTTGFVFASLAVDSTTRFAAIYSGFAIMIMLLIWLHLSWLILLLGANVTFYVQHPQYMLVPRNRSRLSGRLKDGLALALMRDIGEHYHAGQPAPTADQLAQDMGLPGESVERVIDALAARGLLTATASDPPGWVPGRDMETITLLDCLDAVRGSGDIDAEPPDPDGRVHAVLADADTAMRGALGTRSVKDLLAAREA
jgi:membrane protein